MSHPLQVGRFCLGLAKSSLYLHMSMNIIQRFLYMSKNLLLMKVNQTLLFCSCMVVAHSLLPLASARQGPLQRSDKHKSGNLIKPPFKPCFSRKSRNSVPLTVSALHNESARPVVPELNISLFTCLCVRILSNIGFHLYRVLVIKSRRIFTKHGATWLT